MATDRGLVVDLFAGGGGASMGLEAALGCDIDIGINHDPVALAVHRANHPRTRHLEADIWEVRPTDATGGQPVDVLWASPDCTHFSMAKGDVPRSGKMRSLAWAVVRWARETRPNVIFVENVAEFQGWGPLTKDGRPNKALMGRTFKAWCTRLTRLGYTLDYRMLDTSLYGAPTRRRRLFIVARRDGRQVVWPTPTHGPGRLPFHTAAECIDWSLPCPSIFERRRPLAEKTLWRIAQGIKRYVVNSPAPFIVKVNHGKMDARVESLAEPLTTVTATQRGHAIVAPALVAMTHSNPPRPVDGPMPTVTTQHNHVNLVGATLVQTGYGERDGQAARVPHLDKPLGTVVAGGQKHALVSAFMAKHFGGVVGHDLGRPIGTVTARDHHALTAAHLIKLRGQCAGASLDEPMPAITAGGNHLAEVHAFLTAFYSNDHPKGQSLRDPMRTVTAKDRLGLVTVAGVEYQIIDIGMRMLEPHELLRAQFGRFAAACDISAAITKQAKVRLIGNSVPPEMVEAVVRVNVGLTVTARAA